MGEWKIPDTNEAMDRAGERFRVCIDVLREMNEWLDRKGENPPDCIVERAKALDMNSVQYYEYYTKRHKEDWLDHTEQDAIEDWAIYQVQPSWKRNPNPTYPKHWK